METGTTQARGTGRGGNAAEHTAGSIGEPRARTTGQKGWKAILIPTIAVIVTLAVLGGPAAADDLVSNLGEMGLVGTHADYMLSVNNFVMPFTTGTNTSGYRLESISIEFATSGSRTHDPVYVSLLPDNGSGQIATLTRNGINYLGPVAGVNKYSVWRSQCYPQPPHGGGCISRASSAHLDPNTTYWVYIWAGEQATTAGLKIALSQNESGAAGWTIGNAVLGSPVGAAHSNYTTLGLPVKMKVEGTTNPEVLVSITDVTVTEGVELTADFVVRLSRATNGPVQVNYLTVDLPADEGSDYEATSGTLTFRPGETRKTVSVPILDDAVAEGNETFNLILTNLQGATFDNNNGTGTIINAEPLTLSISDATATEGVDATMDFTISLNRATNRTVTVNLLVSSGTADFSDIEYVQTEQSVTFAPGQTEKTYSVGIVDDTVNEPSETFDIVVQSPVSTDLLILADSVGKGTILNTETLTGSFENVPQDHDGSNAFTFNVAFTSDVSIGPAAMRDHAFTVTNGDVTGASRVDGRSDRWLITVDPDGDDAVTITLPGNRACATQGAICSDEDNPVQLSNSPSATVAAPEGDPLTASFSNVPDSHYGGDFFVDLTFSEGPDVGYRDVQKAVKVSGGSINRANRKTKGSNVGWKLKVRPTGTDSLTITLPTTKNCSARGAICTEDGRRLSNSPSATVAGPTVSIAGGSGKEGDDDSIAFTVTLDEAASETVTVDYATADGSAEAGADYTAASGTLSFAAGETSKAISVAIDDDIDNESDETFTVTLSNASGADLGTKTATGTIRNRTLALLTARFENMPAEHDGSEFTFDLHFSENVKAGYARVRDDAFDVNEGEIVAARRKTQGSNQSWTIRVKPEGTGQISITLPETTNCSRSEAICTHDKRPLSNSPSATIPGPAAALDFAHFAKGATITSEMVLVNAATHPSRPAIYFYDTKGDPIPAESVVDLTGDLEVTEDGSLTVRTEMEPLGELTISTHGQGELVSGSVKVLSDGPIGGLVRYSVPEIGVAGVGPGQPTSDALFPVRRQAGGIRTAAALHNLEAEAMGVNCRLMNGGVALEEVEIHLEANGQTSWFIEDTFTATDTSDFLGSVRCTAPGNGRFTAVALEMDAANRIFTTLPVVPVDPPGSGNQQTTLDFAHFANGTGITSEMVFLNPSTQPSRPEIYFYDTEGNPIAAASVVDITGDLEITEDGALTVQTEMEPLGELTISTHGRGELVTGSVRVVSDGPIGGMLRFDLPGVGAGVVGASLPISDAIFPVRRQEGGINTWAALHNLESSAGLVHCDLMREGVLLDGASIPLEANGQMSWFIDQAFPAADTSDFAGSVRCSAVGEGLFSAVALEMDPGTRIFTTLPVAPVPERTDRE